MRKPVFLCLTCDKLRYTEVCITCDRKAYDRQYYRAHREKALAYARKWNAEHPDIVRAYHRKYDQRFYGAGK